jgi:hypothetical protein
VDDAQWADVYLFRAATQTIEKLSIGNNNAHGNGTSVRPRISGDGKYVVFYSEADNLEFGDTNDAPDLFRIDLSTLTVQRVSVGTGGSLANEGALPEFDVSSDGRYTVFASTSTNLVPGDTNDAQDIFLYDAEENITRLISRSNTGDRANGPSYDPTISADGRLIGFRTAATNLLPGDTNPGIEGVIVDLRTNFVLPAAMGLNGAPPDAETASPTFSQDSSAVTFSAAATNLVPGDTNEQWDVFHSDISSSLATTSFLPLGARGYQPSPCISAELEPNNSSGQAGANPPLCQNVAVNGALHAGDTNDYYRVVLTMPSRVTVDLFNISPGSDFDLYLYDSALTELAASRNNGNASERVGPTTLGPGSYYVRVYPDPTEPGGARTYSLRWSR